MASDGAASDGDFNPRSPHGERPAERQRQDDIDAISIHAPRTGSDLLELLKTAVYQSFQSTLPARGATFYALSPAKYYAISIHAPRTGSDGSCHPSAGEGRAISIHAPRTGSDLLIGAGSFSLGISIHAPRTGSDLSQDTSSHAPPLFQSTLPARGATQKQAGKANGWRISIHAPRTGSDARPTMTAARSRRFQSTLPARGATSFSCPSARAYSNFNPRSPHGERPCATGRENGRNLHFNPRSPHGERQAKRGESRGRHAFQSTLPARGATATVSSTRPIALYFNPRSPHGERHQIKPGTARQNGDFNPRSPHGERHLYAIGELRLCIISIHAPRTGSDGRSREPGNGS